MSTPLTSPFDVPVCVLDCPDPHALADFYARLLGWPAPVADGADWVEVAHPDGRGLLAFQLAPDFRAPTWPDPAVPQMKHLDLRVADLPGAREHALAAGARLLDDSNATWTVFADPAGHPFCLCAC